MPFKKIDLNFVTAKIRLHNPARPCKIEILSNIFDRKSLQYDEKL